MKRNLFKRGMAGLLSLVMCLTALVGLGTTTAFAAGEQAEVYLISFPRSGDANLDYGGSWGHPNLQYMNGWYSGNSKYTTIRAMHSYEGNICYCIEPGTAQETGDRYTSKDETFWDNLPADFNSTISPYEMKLFIGRIILEPVEYTKNDGSTGIAYNVKKVFDVAQTSGKKPAAPTLDRDPRKLVAIMLDTAPIDVSTVEELPSPNMGAFYKNEDQTLYIKRDIGDSVALCQCVAQELGHAQLAMNCEAYSRRDMGFSAVCVGYMLCRKFGVDVKNFAIDRIPEELAGKSPKEIRAELSKTRSAMSEIGSRVSEEIYRRRAERSKEQER